ncbi:aldehyde dehydrogenase (NADP(+)) [Kitasatospora cineracea]|uniref:NADP-dependent aldehyde dehydrogenase n=1 Tax=Kitasatospora cineracea TaxID=88074 RepID=A0A8G1UEC3_9ACTN|nr:aldehyde dehydrogenase (NADP(+)) [Kitasatospora cineracea]ROR35696.1 NADP-dependent aldehyde dehydrogenase [Kitasatospora cineracea]
MTAAPRPGAPIPSVDPRTGAVRAHPAREAGPADVDRAVTAAHHTLDALADRPRRAALLHTAADLLDAARPEILAAADAETALGETRLTGELARTTHQLRTFAETAADGGYLDVRIDRADPATGRPDLRRTKTPLGVAAVFAAGNFPLAFSVPGGDTASALAAGCPVVVKAHPGHPGTGELCARLLRRAAERVGLPAEILTTVHGLAAGTRLVQHPLTAAIGFTGSLRGGRALHDLAAARPHPIPFHGELGSLNPVLVTERAAATRAEEIGAGLAASFTLGQGQYCTKPGLVLVPAGHPALERAAVKAAAAADAAPLLDPRIRDSYLTGAAHRAALPGVETLLPPGPAPTPGAPLAVRPGILAVAATDLHDDLLDECFGPLTVLVRYRDHADLHTALTRLPGTLTATLHLAPDEPPTETRPLLALLTPLAGRLVLNTWPTGVTVTPAMHHGGPYPAATTPTTSVGTSAIHRWLRPVTYQDTPPELLPAELRD